MHRSLVSGIALALLLAFLPASAVVGQGERPGVILGKAPEGLDAGTGTILALVRLQ